MLHRKQKAKKLRVAFIGLTSCEGCQFVMLDQGKKFLDWLKKVDVDEFRLIEDEAEVLGRYDICFVEGNPVTAENIKVLETMRKNSDYLVVVGNCAALGGVWELKNYQDKKKTIRAVYRKNRVPNPDIKEVDNFVPVDLVIPGCPIDGAEFLRIINELLVGRRPKTLPQPVCFECAKNGYPCLLQRGEICLGPITLGGCQAVCLKSGQACWGCRGAFAGAAVKNFFSHLKKNFSAEQIDRVLEVFGSRDSLEKALNAKNKK